MEPHLERQIQSIHQRSRDSPLSITQTPQADSAPHDQSLRDSENTTHNMLSGMPPNDSSPSYSPLQLVLPSGSPSYYTTSYPSLISNNFSEPTVEPIKLLIETVNDLKQHIIYSRNVLDDECHNLLRAMVNFESDYEKKPFTMNTPWSAPERFRSATAHILYIRHHHQLALESLGKTMKQIHKEFSKVGQGSLVPPDWRAQEVYEKGSMEKSILGGDVTVEKKEDH